MQKCPIKSLTKKIRYTFKCQENLTAISEESYGTLVYILIKINIRAPAGAGNQNFLVSALY